MNPAAAIPVSDGLLAIHDAATFAALSLHETFSKFIIFDIDTDRPGIYFINTNTHFLHNSFMETVGLLRSEVILGHMVYDSRLVALSGSPGLYYFWGIGAWEPFSTMARAYTVLAAGMPVLNDNLALYATVPALPFLQTELPLFWASRVDLVLDRDISAEGLGVAALYVLDDGVWVSYILGAPEFVNRSFRELFADGLPSITTLLGRSD